MQFREGRLSHFNCTAADPYGVSYDQPVSYCGSLGLLARMTNFIVDDQFKVSSDSLACLHRAMRFHCLPCPSPLPAFAHSLPGATNAQFFPRPRPVWAAVRIYGRAVPPLKMNFIFKMPDAILTLHAAEAHR
jgi:hypothetical protein